MHSPPGNLKNQLLFIFRENSNLFKTSSYKVKKRRASTGRQGKMGNQQIGGDVGTMAAQGGGPPPPFTYGNDARNLALDPDILADNSRVPKTVITPPEDEDRAINGYGVDSVPVKYKSKRRESIAIGENTGSRLQQAHMPELRSMNPSSSRINHLLGVPVPSRVRRGSVDTTPALLLPRDNRSPSPSNKSGSRSKLFDKLLSIPGKGIGGKSSEKLDKIDKKSSPSSSPFTKPRRSRRASDGGVLDNIQSTFQANKTKVTSKPQLEPLDEGSGRYYTIVTLDLC